MSRFSARVILLLLSSMAALYSQESTLGSQRELQQNGRQSLNDSAVPGSTQNREAIARGEKVFATFCAGCHGRNATGGPGAPDLIRSVVVLDDEKAILIGPIIRGSRIDKGMPKLPLTGRQISDVAAWLHARTYAAGHRSTYTFGSVVTGDARLGKAYFDGPGRCSECHSAQGDLVHIGRKYDPLTLQSTWLHPKGRASAKSTPSVTVIFANGQSLSGALDYIDDFFVSFHDSDGFFRSFKRSTGLKVKIDNPLQAHADQLRHYTDADIHNVTAYLASLK
jgi:cytochrome c oxidase cbb3-type subunit 3